MVSTEIFMHFMLHLHKSLGFFNQTNNIGLNKHKEIYMLNFIKKLFGSDKSAEVVVEVKGVEAKTTVEFHEEIKQQVETKKTFPVAKKKAPAKKATAKKPGAKKAPAKIKAEKKSK